ncbi:hypothetical protein B0H66DRAFT_114966 [Apodospora peruviana]|uniref:Uncharacterized protein n=1 Tax=Apodospora peruviana TaxID=516989 RepID=A0AAE0MBR5_9PEZI|nr:hypothetical protein B0H66DRAFT_114966 [Apodospora peruviana]
MGATILGSCCPPHALQQGKPPPNLIATSSDGSVLVVGELGSLLSPFVPGEKSRNHRLGTGLGLAQEAPPPGRILYPWGICESLRSRCGDLKHEDANFGLTVTGCWGMSVGRPSLVQRHLETLSDVRYSRSSLQERKILDLQNIPNRHWQLEFLAIRRTFLCVVFFSMLYLHPGPSFSARCCHAEPGGYSAFIQCLYQVHPKTCKISREPPVQRPTYARSGVYQHQRKLIDCQSQPNLHIRNLGARHRRISLLLYSIYLLTRCFDDTCNPR